MTVGSVMESTRIPLVKWAMAFQMMCSSKKGMSALQLQRNLGLGSYKSAWFMCHRIRLAMEGKPMQYKLSGIVEADETYIGGKPRVTGAGKRGRGTTKKPVMVLVERDGASVCNPLPNVRAQTLRAGSTCTAIARNSAFAGRTARSMTRTERLPRLRGRRGSGCFTKHLTRKLPDSGAAPPE